MITNTEIKPVRVNLTRSELELNDLPQNKIQIIGIDPGGVTGWSLLSLPLFNGRGEDIWNLRQDEILANALSWNHGQIDCKTGDLGELAGTAALTKLIRANSGAVVVMESFQLRQMAVDLSPVRIIARVEDSMWKLGRLGQLMYQAPAAATANDDRLKAWGVYTSAGDLNHARDADRHTMIFLRRCMDGEKGRRLRELAWPHIYGGN